MLIEVSAVRWAQMVVLRTLCTFRRHGRGSASQFDFRPRAEMSRAR
jgi:hypothetical protein